MRHIHLDPLGGVAGDMFVAALLDAFPEQREGALMAAALSGAACRLVPYNDGTLVGARFEVDAGGPGHVHHNHHHEHGGHDHVRWSDIRSRINASALTDAVRGHALGIFTVLAEAEARVHGVAVDDVTFHEVGAADSVADIVAAAWVIAAVSPATWSVAPLPLGSGVVRTAHGLMPIPAPATALLLDGFATIDDGISGERVTPTGAAILKHLAPASLRAAGVLKQSGYGFGTRRLPGLSNCLRVLVFDTAENTEAVGHRDLAVISFEVDDQSGEELSAGIDRVRATEGVHDVVQMAAFGKKSRLAVHVQVLAAPAQIDDVIAACFRETTTIGLRTHIVQGRALARRFENVDVEGQQIRVKVVERPGGATSKAEADHILPLATQSARARVKRAAEQKVLAR